MPELVDSVVHLQWANAKDKDVPAEAFIFNDGTFVTWGASEDQDNEMRQLIKRVETVPYDSSETEQFDYYQDLSQ